MMFLEKITFYFFKLLLLIASHAPGIELKWGFWDLLPPPTPPYAYNKLVRTLTTVRELICHLLHCQVLSIIIIIIIAVACHWDIRVCWCGELVDARGTLGLVMFAVYGTRWCSGTSTRLRSNRPAFDPQHGRFHTYFISFQQLKSLRSAHWQRLKLLPDIVNSAAVLQVNKA